MNIGLQFPPITGCSRIIRILNDMDYCCRDGTGAVPIDEPRLEARCKAGGVSLEYEEFDAIIRLSKIYVGSLNAFQGKDVKQPYVIKAE